MTNIFPINILNTSEEIEESKAEAKVLKNKLYTKPYILSKLDLEKFRFSDEIYKLLLSDVFVYNEGKKIGLNNKKLKEMFGNPKEFVLMFDVDGTLTTAGLEVGPLDNYSIDDFLGDNQKEVEEMIKYLKILKEKGFELAISTGRGKEYTLRINELFGGVFGTLICETGGIIAYKNSDYKSDILTDAKENFENMQENIKTKLVEFILNQNGKIESGKEVSISVNPPEGITIEDFKELIENKIKELDNNYLDYLNVTNSATAVDIIPKGIDKQKAISDIYSNKKLCYFGDSTNDIPAMNIANVNGAPYNGNSKAKEAVRKEGIGFISNKDHLEGTLDNLKIINSLCN